LGSWPPVADGYRRRAARQDVMGTDRRLRVN